MSSVNIASLTETAVRRQKDFKMLPYAVLAQMLGIHGIKLYPGIQNKDVITEFHRKSGIMKPYDTGVAITQSDVAKASEVELEVKTAYASVKDNIKNYQSVSIGPGDLLGANKTKKHPWEVIMISTVVKTFGEDIIDALFPAARDTLVQTPQGAFDGFDTKIDVLVAGGSIAVGKGNLVNTGPIATTNNGLATPVNAAFTAGTGTLAAATYYYRVSAINAIGETMASTETSFTAALNTGVNVNWGAVAGATGYKIYGRATGAQLLISTVGAVVTYLDDGSITPAGALPAENTSDTYAADEALLRFWRAAHPQLRQADSLLLVPYGIGDMYDDAYFTKTLQKPIVDPYNRAVLHGTGGKCKIVRSTAMGTGQRIMLIVPGLLHFGMNTLGDEAFVQVRNPYEDPNLVQFWIQGDYGTRIASVHEKVFQVNEGAAVANALSGDYS